MFFTQEDYRKIEKWLLVNSRKDTDFVGATTPLKGNETVVLVQDGKNVKASVKDVVEQLFLLGVSDFVNITDKYNESYISLSQAIELIPYRSRKIGQVITFLDDTGKWSIYQFQGLRKNQWNTLSLWVDLIALMKGITIIDSEDIVTEVNSANQVALKFADKTYNEADYSGLGRIYLRKNIVDVEDPVTGNVVTMNWLNQSMISKENTIYIIQYDYNLNKQTITIPSGCVLLVEGGSINNGQIDCIDTIIINQWRGTAILSGSYTYQDAIADGEDIDEGTILRFKDKDYNITSFSGLGRVYLRKNIVNNTNILTQEMINKPNTVYIIQYDYNLDNNSITVPEGCVLDFQGGSLSNGTITGNNCKINNPSDYNIFNLCIINNVDISCWDIRWFGAKTNSDISYIIKHICDNLNQNSIPIKIIGNYNFDNGINIKGDFNICGNQFPNRQLTSFVESTKVDISSISIANNITAITIDGSNVISGISPASDSHLNIIGLKILGNNKTSTFIEYKVTGAPSRPGIIDRIEATGLDSVIKFTGISTKGGTVYCTLPITNCNIYNCNYSIYSDNVHNQLSIGCLDINNNVLEHGAKLNLINLFGYNKISNCLLEGQSDAINIKMLFGHLDFIGNYFEVNSGNCLFSGTDIVNNSVSIKNTFRVQDTQIYKFENIRIKEIDDIDIIKNANYTFAKVPRNFIKELKESNIVLSSNRKVIITDAYDKEMIIDYTNDFNNIIGNFKTSILDETLNITGREYTNSGVYYANYLNKSVSIGDKIAVTFYKSTIGGLDFQFIGTGATLIKEINESFLDSGVYTIIFNSNRNSSTINIGFKASGAVNQIVSNCSCYIINENDALDKFVKIPDVISPRTKGTISQRPITLSATNIGFQYFDTTLSKPIWWQGSSWIDSTGTVV